MGEPGPPAGADPGHARPGAAVRVVSVVPDVAGVRKVFDYTVPDALADEVRVGSAVRVVLHNRRVAGWVVADDVVAPDRALSPILAVRGWGPPASVVELARWAAWRWAGPPARLLGTASAPAAVRGLPSPPSVRPTGDRPGGPAAALSADALSGGTAVVRLAPAHDPVALCDAAARLGSGRPPAGPAPGTLVLAPSHDAAARLAGRLRALGHAVALLPGQWAQARAGGCVAVGSRAAAFAPLPALAAAIVLDAHDEAYHEERAPTWSAWEVVAERARRDGAPCALVSPCPTLDVLAAGRLLVTSRHDERAGWPPVEVVDRRADDPRSGLYSERLVTLVRWAVAEPGRRVLCVLNRTGRVRLLACAACGELVRCERCGAASESAPDGRLSCRRCGASRPAVCARCGATRLKALRVGVTRAREELEALAGTAVAEVWGAPGRADRADGAPDGAAVVVGTEAVLHRVGRADAVAFLDVDAELLAPRLRAAEEAMALLARAARLVAGAAGADGASTGRAHGRVMVQTRQPQHPALGAAVAADPSLLADAEAPLREALRLPPVTALALVSGAAADAYGAALAEAAGAEVEVRGPVDGTWSVRAPDHDTLCRLLDETPRPPGRLRVEVDPVRA